MVLATSMTLEELSESYDYDFSLGTLNVTGFSDSMIDADTDGVNDTLVINLTVSGNGTYLFYAELWDDARIVNSTNASVNASSPHVQVYFSTAQLSRSQYNYTVKARSPDGGTIYTKYRVQTSAYGAYEQGVRVHTIADQEASGSLVVTVVLNATENSTSNVTALLAYGNRTLAASALHNVTALQTSVNLTFPADTIAATHHTGAYSVRAITVDNRTLATNHTTALYDFEDFATRSYFKNVTSAALDANADGVFENLTINVTVAVFDAGTYGVTASVFTSDGSFVAALDENRTLAQDNQTVQLAVQGPVLYATRHTGAFLVSGVSLRQGGTTIDALPFSHESAAYAFSDFTPPERPDLALNLTADYALGASTVTVNVTNLGEAPAYNVVLDVFDDTAYENQTVLPVLAANASETLTFTVPGTSLETVFVAIADFDNQVDEENESNNLADNMYRSLSVELSELYGAGKREVIEAVLASEGTEAVGETSWSLDLGDGLLLNGSVNLSRGESASLIIEHDYATKSEFTATLNASAENLTNSATLVLSTTDLLLSAIISVQQDLTSVFLFDVGAEVAPLNASWTVGTGEGNVTSESPIALAVGENASVIVEYQYALPGAYVVNASANDSEQVVSRTMAASILELFVHNLHALSTNASNAIFEFNVADAFSVPKNASWSFDTNETGTIAGAQDLALAPGENATVIVAHGYAAAGAREVVARANTTGAGYAQAHNVVLS